MALLTPFVSDMFAMPCGHSKPGRSPGSTVSGLSACVELQSESSVFVAESTLSQGVALAASKDAVPHPDSPEKPRTREGAAARREADKEGERHSWRTIQRWYGDLGAPRYSAENVGLFSQRQQAECEAR